MSYHTYKSKEDWMQKNGFNEEGVTYIITGGNTFKIKDTLKAMGCKFSPLLKWHCPEEIVIEGFNLVPFTFDELYSWLPMDKDVMLHDTAKMTVQERLAPFATANTILASNLTNTEWLGEVGDRLRKIPAKIVGKKEINNQNGYCTLFTFESGNSVLCWFTSTTKFEQVGDEVLLSATVKSHKIYEGQKQTYVTRCLMYPIE